jgi:hypothetical protein
MKRALSIVAALGVLATLAATPVNASAAAAKAIIKDPINDANFVNDQGTGDGSLGDQDAASAGTVSDLLGITLSNDAKNLYLTIETQAQPPAATAIGYRVRFNGTPGQQCLLVEAMYPGANNALTVAEAYLIDNCNGGAAVPVKVLGTQIVVPRKLSKAFAKGAKLDTPQAQSFFWSGSSYPAGVGGPMIDTTKVGTDYALVK